MAPETTLAQRARVGARVAVSKGLGLVPLPIIESARRRRLLVPLLRHRSLKGLGIVTVEGEQRIRLLANDSLLVRMLYWYGEDGYEPHEATWWRRFCQDATGVLEIGANIGYYTVLGALANPKATYTAVEAHPGTAETVTINVGLNGLRNVTVVQAAVVGEGAPDHLDLALPDLEKYDAPTGAFIVGGEGVGGRRPAHHTISVPTVTGVSLIDDVDLLKLDIEGLEYDVLQPIADQLVERRTVVLVEVLRDTPRLRHLLAQFAEKDYGFWIIDEHLRRISSDDLISVHDFARTFGSRDIAVIPAERNYSSTS